MGHISEVIKDFKMTIEFLNQISRPDCMKNQRRNAIQNIRLFCKCGKHGDFKEAKSAVKEFMKF